MDEHDILSVDVAGFSPTQQPGGYAVFLREKGTQRCVPIVVGAAEAQAISFILAPLQLERPMTHDTFKNIIDALQGTLVRVVVTRIEDNTFFADIMLRNAQGDIFHLDARPSDAIALALRNGADIGVARAVMESSGVELPKDVLEGKKQDMAYGEAAAPETAIARVTRALEKAIEEERYEDAARLRDELRTLKKNEEEDTSDEEDDSDPTDTLRTDE